MSDLLDVNTRDEAVEFVKLCDNPLVRAVLMWLIEQVDQPETPDVAVAASEAAVVGSAQSTQLRGKCDCEVHQDDEASGRAGEGGGQ